MNLRYAPRAVRRRVQVRPEDRAMVEFDECVDALSGQPLGFAAEPRAGMLRGVQDHPARRNKYRSDSEMIEDRLDILQ